MEFVLKLVQEVLFHLKNILLLHFQQANLQGVKMVLANLEGASLRGCNFEDPAGSKANMEGESLYTMFGFIILVQGCGTFFPD